MLSNSESQNAAQRISPALPVLKRMTENLFSVSEYISAEEINSSFSF